MWLLTESVTHHFYALSCIAAQACKKDKWATFEFFMEAEIDGMRESESGGSIRSEQLFKTLIKRYNNFEAMGGEARIRGEHYKSSAILISEKDESSDIEEITETLNISTQR